ncbi:hypothetical protein [Anaeromusa acidaminophila]|uniref:hypothetical protein n=1 Tax=Anaeromusa acidaminophila TaxID=81464 RepID=UPI0003735CA5|nr:hypothetical protein [Anaeromusa acidaminophila]
MRKKYVFKTSWGYKMVPAQELRSNSIEKLLFLERKIWPHVLAYEVLPYGADFNEVIIKELESGETTMVGKFDLPLDITPMEANTFLSRGKEKGEDRLAILKEAITMCIGPCAVAQIHDVVGDLKASFLRPNLKMVLEQL